MRAGEHLRYLNREVRTRDHAASDEAFLNVSVPIAALEGLDDGLLGPEAVPLQLLDTPGPNEAGEESLRYQVGGLLQALGCNHHRPGKCRVDFCRVCTAACLQAHAWDWLSPMHAAC